MADFIQYFMAFSELDEAAVNALLQNVTTKSFDKGTYLLKEGDVCKHLYFINEGLVKSSFYKGDKEFIMRFFPENILFSLFDSYFPQTPSRCMITALENTTVTRINYHAMETLCQKHHCIETFFRKLVAVASAKMMKRISEMLEENATERYNLFLQENSAIIQRINLGDLAKYLGIAQQSLSRIRATR
jgi:CRP-like cAMP-binding protein